MADNVQKILERSIPELEDLQERGLFNEKEIRSITNKRRDYEYRLQRRGKTLEDFLRYIEYEISIDKLRLLRKQKKKLQKNTLSDYSCTKRVQFIYDRALQRFQQNVSLWLKCIDHAISTKSGKRVGRLFPRALRLHPLNVSLWVKAAEWECNGNQSFSSARILLSRGLRLNKGNPTLFRELFELELSYASVILERRRVLGLDTGAAKENDERESNNENQLVIPQLPGEAEESNQRPNNEDAQAKVMQGALATIVFDNGAQAIQGTEDRIDFAIDCLKISTNFYHDISNVTNHILGCFQNDAVFSKSEKCWEAHAQWISVENEEATDASRNAGKKRSRNSASMLDVNKKQKCVELYHEAIKILPTAEMYDYYLKFLLSHGNGLEIENCFSLLEDEDVITVDQYGEWIRVSPSFTEITKAYHTDDKRQKNSNGSAKSSKKELSAYDIAQKAVHRFPKEARSWLLLLDVMLHNLQYDSSAKALKILDEHFKKATRAISPLCKNAASVDLKWIDFQDAMQVELGEISKHTLMRLRDGNLSDEDKILLSQRFISIASDNKDGRMHFHAFINNMMHFTKDTKPIFLVVPWEVYKMAIYCEMTIAGLDSDVAFIRKLFEAAIVSNPDNEELWLDYVRFESEKPGDVSKVTQINWRAGQSLSDKDAFEEKLGKIQAGLI